MGNRCFILLLVLGFLISGISSASASVIASSAPASAAAKIVGGVVTNVASAIFKWLWSLKSTTKPAISSRSMMKFESGYTVETVFDGSKHGIEPYSVEMSPSGELLVLDSENSNIYKISTPLSRYSRPKLVIGSPEGYSGHIDGRPREARLNHPKGLTVDERGNVYVADTMNMAIRKISDSGVVTIAGGKRNRGGGGGGHVDGPSEDAKFSDDFEVVYVGSSCSLLVIDRGNQAIREIQLHDDDCSYENDGNLHIGAAVLISACFFGYMLALLQRRIAYMFSSDNNDSRTPRKGMPATTAPYQKPHKSVRQPLIPPESEYDKSEESLFGSLGRLFAHTGSSIFEIFGGFFSGRKKQPLYHHHIRQHYNPYLHHKNGNNNNNSWPVQESFVIPDEDEPPPPPPPAVESRDPTPRKGNYPPLMSKELERTRHYNRQNHPFYTAAAAGGVWTNEVQQHQNHHHHHHHQHQQVQQLQKQQHHQQHHKKQQSSRPQTYYEQSCETNEIVFGAVQVQEQDGRREAMVIKAVDYGDPIYNNHNIRSRYNYMGYSYGYN